MKKVLSKLTPLLLLAVLVFQGCDDDDIPPIGDAGSKLDGINANWRLVSFVVTDETTFPIAERDLTAFLSDGSSVPSINFNSGDGTYTADAVGKKSFFGSGGTWAFDDNEFPTMITLNSNDMGTIAVPLTNTIRPTDSRLRIQVERKCGDNVYSLYKFEYERAN